MLTRAYDYVVIDGGNIDQLRASSAALYAADTIFLVTNPDVPSIRNAQRLVERVRQLGAGSERVKVLLNRVSDQHLIAPKQIETALGYGIHHTFTSDYRTVSTALNSGVPLALTNHSELARSSTASRASSSACRPRSAEAGARAQTRVPGHLLRGTVNHELSAVHHPATRPPDQRRGRRRGRKRRGPGTSS